MKRSALFAVFGVAALSVTGCSLLQRSSPSSSSYQTLRRAPTFAIAVTVHGGLQPTAAQWAAIQAKVADELSWQGGVLVTDLSLADRIIRIDFQPDPQNPENAGRLVVLGVRTNPYAGYPRTNPGPYASSFGFSNSFYSSPNWWGPSRWWGSSDYYSGDYYNYTGPWENGYTSGATPVAVIPKPTPPPPHRRRPVDGEICPPDALHPRPPLPSSTPSPSPRFAVQETAAAFVNNSPATPAAEPAPRRWTGERSAWRSDATTASSRPERTYARNDPSTSRERTYHPSDASGSSRTYASSGSNGSSWRGNSGSSRTERSERSARTESGTSRSEGGWWRSNRDSSSSDRSASSSSSSSSSSYSSPSSSYSASDSSSSGSFSSSSSSSASYSSPPPAPSAQESSSSPIER